MSSESKRALQKVVVDAFGGVEQLNNQAATPLSPKAGEVVIDLKSVGMNQADLMARRGEYRLSSGEPPFTPGIEGGGIITAMGEGVSDRQVGQHADRQEQPWAYRQQVQPQQVVMLPAASSSVAIAASQIVKKYGGITIGTTTSPQKIEALQALTAAQYDHIVLTKGTEQPWWRTVKKTSRGKGGDVIFDPVAAGEFLHHEIRLLASGGTIW